MLAFTALIVHIMTIFPTVRLEDNGGGGIEIAAVVTREAVPGRVRRSAFIIERRERKCHRPGSLKSLLSLPRRSCRFRSTRWSFAHGILTTSTSTPIFLASRASSPDDPLSARKSSLNPSPASASLALFAASFLLDCRPSDQPCLISLAPSSAEFYNILTRLSCWKCQVRGSLVPPER